MNRTDQIGTNSFVRNHFINPLMHGPFYRPYPMGGRPPPPQPILKVVSNDFSIYKKPAPFFFQFKIRFEVARPFLLLKKFKFQHFHFSSATISWAKS